MIYAVIDLLGPSLEDLFRACGKRFSLKTSLMIWYQIVERLEAMHEREFMHADLKPENLLMGLKERSNIIHMIDFGLTRSVADPKTGEHIPLTRTKSLSGTIRYISLNGHKGYALSRRDDLISLGYMIIRFITGGLPWQKIATRKNSLFDRGVGKSKALHQKDNKLYKGCPVEVHQYMNYVTSLKFKESANFNHLRTLIKRAAQQANVDIFDEIFDWDILFTNQESKVDLHRLHE